LPPTPSIPSCICGASIFKNVHPAEREKEHAYVTSPRPRITDIALPRSARQGHVRRCLQIDFLACISFEEHQRFHLSILLAGEYRSYPHQVDDRGRYDYRPIYRQLYDQRHLALERSATLSAFPHFSSLRARADTRTIASVRARPPRLDTEITLLV